MRYKIKHARNKYKIYDETNGLISIITKKAFGSDALIVDGADQTTVLCVMHRDGEITIESNGKKSVQCSVRYQIDGKDKLSAYWRPAMMESIFITTSYGILMIHQARKRSFEVFLNDHVIGQITHTMSMDKEMVVDKDLPPWFIGMIVAIAYFMFHDDDIEIV